MRILVILAAFLAASIGLAQPAEAVGQTGPLRYHFERIHGLPGPKMLVVRNTSNRCVTVKYRDTDSGAYGGLWLGRAGHGYAIQEIYGFKLSAKMSDVRFRVTKRERCSGPIS